MKKNLKIMNENTEVIIERGKDATFSAYIASGNVPFGLLGDGKTVKETIEDFYNSYEEMKAYYESEKKEFPNLKFEFKYDVASFLSYYGMILSFAGLERLTGINQGQLSHYVTGHRKPSKRTTQKIEKKLHEFAEELHQLSFV